MIIGTDVRWLHKALSFGIFGGIGGYSYHLISSLLPLDSNNEYILFGMDTIPTDLLVSLFKQENVKVKFLPVPKELPFARASLGFLLRDLQENIIVNGKIKKEKLDLFHSHNYFKTEASLGKKNIITVYDLASSVFPEYYTKNPLARRLQALYLNKLRKADKIIAISQNTAHDITKYCGIKEDKIKVIYLGLSPEFKPPQDNSQAKEVLAKHKVTKPYILYVGGLHPTKNLHRVLEAFSVLLNRNKDLDICMVTVSVSKESQTEDFRAFQKTIDHLRIADKIVLTGGVSNEELVCFYSQAICLAHPSLYEGFGLTPLEAMGCGCPVLVSDRASLPEVVGQAGVYVNPYKVEDIAEKLAKLVQDSALRTDLTIKGLKQAKKFTWEKTAQETLSVYRELQA